MKLRSKETGEIGYLELEKGDDEKYIGFRVYKNDFVYKRYRTLLDLGAEWEDYKPTEPRLKDDRFRKAVRAWFNILPRLEDKRILYENGVLWVGVYEFDCGQYDLLNLWLKSGEYYTLEELCGEEE